MYKELIPIRWRVMLRGQVNNARARFLIRLVMRRWQRMNKGDHCRAIQDGVIISLTSYQARFSTIELTLKCLLMQTVRPERIILWVGHQDRQAIPASVENLTKYGLEIRATEDVRSFTKIVPALLDFPDAIIVTADDDLYYPPDWLASLLGTWSGRKDEIVCHRAHKVTLGSDGGVLSYNRWKSDIRHAKDGALLFPTGVSGVLYPPHCLYADVTKKEIFLALSPHADDIWLYWMGRLNDATYAKTTRRFRIVTWPKSQGRSLAALNVDSNENDRQIRNLLDRYPISFSSPPAANGLQPAAFPAGRMQGM